jgi:hypothetical protein
MSGKNVSVLNCDQLAQAIENGTATQQLLANVGLEHTHNIYLVKVVTGTDPDQAFSPSGGSEFFKVRPNGRDTQPSNENGHLWDWYLLSCPHDPPCPFM